MPDSHVSYDPSYSNMPEQSEGSFTGKIAKEGGKAQKIECHPSQNFNGVENLVCTVDESTFWSQKQKQLIHVTIRPKSIDPRKINTEGATTFHFKRDYPNMSAHLTCNQTKDNHLTCLTGDLVADIDIFPDTPDGRQQISNLVSDEMYGNVGAGAGIGAAEVEKRFRKSGKNVRPGALPGEQPYAVGQRILKEYEAQKANQQITVNTLPEVYAKAYEASREQGPKTQLQNALNAEVAKRVGDLTDAQAQSYLNRVQR